VSLSLAELQAVVEEIRPCLEGGRLENVHPAGREAIVLAFYAQREKVNLLISARPGFSRLHLVSERPEARSELPHFVRVVRQGLRGHRLEEIALVGGDRVVELRFARRGEAAGSLVAELTGRTSNIYCVGADGRLVAALRRPGKGDRALRPGSAYHPPAPAPTSAAAARDRFAGEGSYSEAIARHYARAEAEEDLAALRRSVASRLRSERKRLSRLVDKLRAELKTTEDLEDLRLKGELLKIHLHAVQPRAKVVVVENLFDEGRPEVQIALDPRLSPRANMERYFRRYKKLRAAQERGQKRLADALERLDEVDRQLHAVEAAESAEELEAIAAGLGRRAARRPITRRSGPLTFTSADGYEILVARNAQENDTLTFRLARGSDLWLHVEGYRGSHVVVRLPKGKSCPKETLLDAATLAVQYSELRTAGAGPVVYCARKHVAKPRTGGPGDVLYSHHRTINVEVDSERLRRLMGKAPP